MNLAELRTEIEAHPKTIKVEDLPDEDFGFYLFWRITYEKGEDEADQMAVCIIIDERGEVDEKAWYKGKPAFMKDAEPTPFKDDLETALVNYVDADSKTEYYQIDSVDESGKVAKVTLYEKGVAANSVIEKRFIVFDRNGLKVRRIEDA